MARLSKCTRRFSPSSKRRARKLQFENCEKRELFSIDLVETGGMQPDADDLDVAYQFDIVQISHNATTGEIEVIGTDGGDSISVVELPGVPSQIKVEAVESDGHRSTLIVDKDDITSIDVEAGGGDDTFTNNTDVPSRVKGGSGIDRLTGGSGSDILYGDGNDDVLTGKGGNDLLYGGKGMDILRGGNGLDGLFGGENRDTLTGGGGADRFLVDVDEVSATNPALIPEDTITNIRTEDAVVQFADADSQIVHLGDSDYQFGSGSWGDKEILAVDQALSELVAVIGNTTLLETSDGGRITFYRAGAESSPRAIFQAPYVEWVSTTTWAGWNSNDGTITLVDATFDSNGDGSLDEDKSGIHGTVYHEIAHNWDDENSDWAGWLDISGWTQSFSTAATSGRPIAQSNDGEWWYDPTDAFSTDINSNGDFDDSYGRTNAFEDFATQFSFYMKEISGAQTTDAAILADLALKMDFMDDFIDSLL